MLPVFRAPPSRSGGGSSLCIGAFDGLHRGHLALIERTVAWAAADGLEPLALTMDPLPREFFLGELAPPRIQPLGERLRGLLAAGVHRVGLMRFDQRVAGLSAEAFAASWLARGLAARRVVVGVDFRFGKEREGDVGRLAELGRRFGFAVEVVEAVLEGGEPVSSTRLRAALQAGDFALAERLLGRRFALSGRVRPGRRLGRVLGFPTANLPLGRRRYACEGIHAVRVDGEGLQRWPGVASIGQRPTVGGGETWLEVHLFDFAGDLYGKQLRVEFCARLREERRFPSLEAMIEEMRHDAERARAALAA
ncbi:MAG: riboflavin biosynthesis protein [Lysobacterales bacterium]|jgi:riboflavin kinase/FMN adenylyltransferase|nr:MAG: riboflavin biosynthesis protein [Xanthomonadales bacterium]